MSKLNPTIFASLAILRGRSVRQPRSYLLLRSVKHSMMIAALEAGAAATGITVRRAVVNAFRRAVPCCGTLGQAATGRCDSVNQAADCRMLRPQDAVTRH